MKIAIFENEYKSVKLAFEACNAIFFQGGLELVNFARSQEFGFDNINDFEVFFIDIDLSIKSHLDGYALIKEMIKFDPNIGTRIVVLTGNNRIQDGLRDNDIDVSQIKNIIIKPTNFKEIGEKIREILANRSR
ncbi:hypothetical protein [Sphingobacterium multivorum]|uniref:hypothetical protein n=1 Tax=Sphingobacterium multivorum TaxID=28454 RepID=UPI0028AB6507|nr:hypothetical protein [Sphingobacterium multivorum]